MITCRRRAVQGLVVAAVLGLPAAAVAGSGGVSVTPAASSPHRSHQGQVLDLGPLRPGQSVADALVLRTAADTPQRVRLYPADGVTATGGGVGFGLAGDRPSAFGSWARLSATAVTVTPGAGVAVRLSVTLPPRVAAGGYVGGVVAEQVPDGAAGPAPQGSVRPVYRFAMPVYFSVPAGAPGATPGRGRAGGTVEVESPSISRRGDLACPSLSYRNDSEMLVNPDARVSVDPHLLGGRRVTTVRGVGAVLPGDRVAVRLPCQRVPLGGAKVGVTLQGPGVAPMAPYVRDVGDVPLVLELAVFLLLLLILLLALLAAREWQRRRSTRSL